MTHQIDPIPYLRFPQLDVAEAIGLAKILLHRVPKGSSPMVRKAASLVESSVTELGAKWTQQVVPITRDMRPLARRLGAAWSAVRDRLATYTALPDGSADRTRATAIHDLLFPDGLEFILAGLVRQHGESERRLQLIEERGLAKDLARLVGDHFFGVLRSAHQAYGDALGISKATLPAVAVVLTEPLRALAEAIAGYALQLLAVARHDPEKREAVVLALSPIDEFRASVGRRAVAVAADDDDDVEVDEDDDVVVTMPPAPTPPVVLAPVA